MSLAAVRDGVKINRGQEQRDTVILEHRTAHYWLCKAAS